MTNPLAGDLERAFGAGTGPWSALRNARIFFTGATGFFGGWLLESLLWGNERHALDLSVTVLTRGPDAFRAARPHLANHPAVVLQRGDVLTLEPDGSRYTHVLHAATAASVKVNVETPRLMFDTIVEGTRRALAVARRSGARRFLLTSSGAVYGRQPPALTHVPEEHPGGPDPCDPASAYGEGKRAAELLACLAAREHGFDAVIARCFAFSGPYLPLDIHFAIGNFVRDALAGGPIRIGGDGTPFRSYLHGADLAAWLLTLLGSAPSGRAFNVGSERAVSIAELAGIVARELGAPGVEIAKAPTPGRPAERYVPSTRRAREELGLVERFTLEESVRRMAEFAGHRPA